MSRSAIRNIRGTPVLWLAGRVYTDPKPGVNLEQRTPFALVAVVTSGERNVEIAAKFYF